MSITWNGVSSDTIGVIVERIPNRYVPTRRFSPQQVAGRNGNILLVDKSFPNVEQEYEVYLSAEAQGLPSVARACAEWLMGPDGYCRLEDSYDTTVYREAFLMGGYDLENILNKFGRCTITFSCKPQKYLLTGDTPIEIPAGTTTTYTGSSVQFDGITGASITSLSTTITPTQDLHGYANPWPAGGGVNKFDASAATFKKWQLVSNAFEPKTDDYEYISFSVSGDNITLTTQKTYMGICFAVDAVDYDRTASLNGIISGGKAISLYGSYTSGATRISNGATSCSIPANTSGYVAIRIDSAQTCTINCQIEQGSTASSWTPYSNICPISGRTGLNVYVSPTQDPQDATTYAVDWTTEAGTVYGGTLDVVTGLLTVDKYLYVYDGTEPFQKSGTALNGFYNQLIGTNLPHGWPAMANYNSISAITDEASSMMIPTRIGSTYRQNYGYVYLDSGHNFNVPPEEFGTTVASFKAKLASLYAAGTPLTVFCKLATPLTYQLSAQEVEALVGTNNVWSSSGDVSVTVSTPLGGFVTNPTPFEARPLLEVSGVGEITINGKSIQILESVSDFDIDCEAKEAEDNSKIYCMDFPDLSGGENEIVSVGSITALTVTPRWWTL